MKKINFSLVTPLSIFSGFTIIYNEIANRVWVSIEFFHKSYEGQHFINFILFILFYLFFPSPSYLYYTLTNSLLIAFQPKILFLCTLTIIKSSGNINMVLL
jgi:hypothetical protein